MYQLLDLFKSPDPIVLNFKMQLKCSFIVKKGSSFRSQACCHWGVNFQFKHIEHIEAKSNFLYETPSHHSLPLFNPEFWLFFRCNCIVVTFGKDRSKVSAQGTVQWCEFYEISVHLVSWKFCIIKFHGNVNSNRSSICQVNSE